MANRLANATSPYLQQHRDNPVDWWPWGPEAFAEAARRDVPVLLSVGYSACHWCHVMAHESFEDPDTARLVNEHAVAVKVDREERPDVDAVYLTATQAMTGQGGWPMTCFLTPTGEPYYCGTYFPREPFRRLVVAAHRAWREQREAVVEQSRRLVAALGRAAAAPPRGVLSADLLAAAAAGLVAEHDPAAGGFGGAPKFPPAMCLEFLLRHHARTGHPAALTVVERTAERMARGGIYDQLAGGFARYSVDAGWVVPHFEKMLYDNALLLRLYAHLWRETGSALAHRVATETAGFLRAGLGTPEGGFASALDADAAGVEGLSYVWTPDQLRDVLGAADGAWAAELLAVTAGGTFEHGASTLQLPADPSDVDRWAGVRARLLAARAQRPQPDRDDKVVAAWNGLAVAALADAGGILDDPTLIAAATAAAGLLLGVHLVDGDRLLRTSRDGRPGTSAGVLEDYADVAEGLLALHQATGEARWLAVAGRLLDTMLDRFGDGEGGWYDTAADAGRLIVRPRELTDNATPSGASAAAGALLGYAALTGSQSHRAAAEGTLAGLAGLLPEHARFAGWAAAVAEAALAGPLQVAVVGPPGPAAGAAELARFARLARLGTAPGTVVVAGAPDTPGVPLLVGRPPVGGRPTAYVCRGFVCDAPTTDPAVLAAALRVQLT